MNLVIEDNKELEKNISLIQKEKFIAIDTEFIRETTYFAKLCLIQVASKNHSFIIDPLSQNINLDPFWVILNDHSIIKIFHSGRQDMEIFFYKNGKLPISVYDTQIAAMVCGYGDQVSYENLVYSLLKIKIDKSSRVSNWSFRPLSEKQITYALSDVTHLIKIYEILKNNISKNKREDWIQDEMANFSKVLTYKIVTSEAWKKIKIRTTKKEVINRIKFLAEWRENKSIERNVPKNRIMKDDIILNLASNNPLKKEDFKRVRGFNIDKSNDKINEILKLITKANSVPEHLLPEIDFNKKNKIKSPAILELLKVLLKYVSEENRVAQKLIAKQDDLEAIANGNFNNSRLLQGWRYKIFGKIAIDLFEGEISIKIKNKKIFIVDSN